MFHAMLGNNYLNFERMFVCNQNGTDSTYSISKILTKIEASFYFYPVSDILHLKKGALVHVYFRNDLVGVLFS